MAVDLTTSASPDVTARFGFNSWRYINNAVSDPLLNRAYLTAEEAYSLRIDILAFAIPVAILRENWVGLEDLLDLVEFLRRADDVHIST